MLKKVISNESGRILVWTLVILALGTLLIPPLLARVSANLIASRAIEEGLKEQYAADAGVEYALRRIGQSGCFTDTFSTPSLVNNMPVSVTVELKYETVCRIVALAGGTTIESYLSQGPDLSWLMDYAITSPGDVTVKGDVIGKEVRCPEEPSGNGSYDWFQDDVSDWPAASIFSEYYSEDVAGDPVFAGSYIDVADTPDIGPFYRDGDLTIDNTGGHITATLQGTLYINGDLTFAQPGASRAYTLDLNGNSIYVEGDLFLSSHHIDVAGSGCIIARGNLTLQPGAASAEGDFVFAMSIDGWADIKPGNSWYGAIAGEASVDFFPGGSLVWSPPPGNLNFPKGNSFDITTYDVRP